MSVLSSRIPIKCMLDQFVLFSMNPTPFSISLSLCCFLGHFILSITSLLRLPAAYLPFHSFVAGGHPWNDCSFVRPSFQCGHCAFTTIYSVLMASLLSLVCRSLLTHSIRITIVLLFAVLGVVLSLPAPCMFLSLNYESLCSGV